ncbi:MAG TPA: alginate lyase family protein [Gammaproteobacteria bacterium]|nr:alginate lyase family protein [Gammaproteobacteria bacterium]
MRLQRVLHAGLPVLANRGWQELRRSADRMTSEFATSRRNSVPAALRRGAFAIRPANPGSLAATQPLTSETSFPEPNPQFAARLLGERFPEFRERILAEADAACERRLRLLGREFRFAGGFDWHRDPASGRRAPLLHWSRLDPLNALQVGDSKFVWELNRHQWLVGLATAWRLTANERYAQAVASALQDWMRANPPGIGINWASSLEVSLRLIAWCWILHLLAGSRSVTAELRRRMREQIHVHATHVERYMSHFFSPNTHLTGEALGLVYAGTLLAGLPRAARWRRVGARVLLRELERQVLPDGVHFEQSTCYARYTAEIYLHFCLLDERAGTKLAQATKPRLCKLLDYLLAIRRPDGSLPPIGDDDGGRLLPLAPRAPDDCRELFALAAVLFSRADYAWAAGGPAPEIAWFLGREGWESFAALPPAPPDAAPSQIFSAGGYAVMRGSWDRDAHQLVFDAGPLGCPYSGGHGHADLLSIQCSPFGHAQLSDPGTYCYTAAPAWRKHFRGSRAHSTVVVDGESQALAAGPFSWASRPRARLRRWISTPQFDLADGEHEAYARLRDPVSHRRRVLYVKPRYWIVVDDLDGWKSHRIELLLQFTAASVVSNADGWWQAADGDGWGLFVRAFAPVALAAHIERGATAPIAGWESADYGQRTPAPLLVHAVEALLPLRIVTVLLPRAPRNRAPEALFAANRLSLRFPEGRESLRFEERAIRIERDGDAAVSLPLAGHPNSPER